MGSARLAFCTEVTDFIRADGACPDPRAVEAEVFKLTSPEGRAKYLPGARVQLFDGGDNYAVEIQKGSETYRKSYDDPARACDQRARVVAVTIVMTLMPPDLSEETQADPESEAGAAHAMEESALPKADTREAEPVPAPPPTKTEDKQPRETVPESASASSRSVRLPELELGAWFQHSLSNSEVPRIAAWGGELVGAWGTPHWAGLLAVSAGGSSSFELGDIRASMAEATARAGVRALWPATGVTFALEAAFVVAGRRVSAEAPNAPEPGAAWELGGSAGANVAWDAWRPVAPVAGLRLNVFPVPSELEAAPQGTIGSLPKFWLAAHAGVRFGL